MPALTFFDTMKISFVMYVIIVILSVIVLGVSIGYLYWNYHFGKPLAPFFLLRVKGWTQRNVALFEIFTLTNTVHLEEARKEIGDGYRIFTPSAVKIPTKKESKIEKIFNYLFARKIAAPKTPQIQDFAVKKVNRIQNLIMPKSTYSINGVNTVPLLDLHPQLHPDVLEGLEILTSKGLHTLEELEKFISIKERAEQPLFKNYNYRTFYDLYMGARQKFSVTVTTDDVANFIGSNFDKHFRESLEAKDFNMFQNKKIENKTMMWGYAAIILTIVIVGIRILYITFYK